MPQKIKKKKDKISIGKLTYKTPQLDFSIPSKNDEFQIVALH